MTAPLAGGACCRNALAECQKDARRRGPFAGQRVVTMFMAATAAA